MKNLKTTIYPNKGFTLVEMAIVLAIVALLLGGLLPVISGQIEQQHRNETRKYMDEVRDALLGYVVAKKYLPCPDTDNDGLQNAPCTAAAFSVGKLPYKDLGVSDKDAYGNQLRYAITKEFADQTPASLFKLSNVGILRVCSNATCTPATNILTSGAVAVIVSQGANWPRPAEFSAEEIENDNTNADFVSKDLVQNGYDDLVVWLSPNILFNRMVAAGQLP